MAKTFVNPVTPPLGATQVTGFLSFAAQLFFRNIAKEIHGKQDTEYRIRNTAKIYRRLSSCLLFSVFWIPQLLIKDR